MKNKKIIMITILLSLFFISNAEVIKNPKTAKVGETVNFTKTIGTSPYDPCGTSRWDFGDGNVKGVYYPGAWGSPVTQSHIFTQPGTYIVKFIYGGCSIPPTPGFEATSIVITHDQYIDVTPSNPDVGKTVTFTLVGALAPPILWDFGDGTPKTSSTNSVTHIYNKEGNYTVKAYDNGGANAVAVTQPIKVNLDPRRVSWTPTSPFEGQNVNFASQFFNASSLQWNFGDGTIIVGAHNISHTFQNPGIYTLKVTDYAGDDVKSIDYQIVVKQDPRQLQVSNPNPAVGERVIFEASQFFSSKIEWNFGDGIQTLGGPIMQHIFAKDGMYTVRAFDPATGVAIRTGIRGNAAGLDKVFEIPITVSATSSQVSDLMITGMEIFFERNNRGYLTIPLQTEQEKVKAILKYEGTGLLSGYWAIDGQPYKLISETLSFGQHIELLLDEIPTLIKGIHSVSIIFNYPTPSFEVIPSVQYFVSALSRYINVVSPDDQFDFALVEQKEFKWDQYSLALNYRLVNAENLEELMNLPDSAGQETSQTTLVLKGDLKSKVNYVWQVRAIDANNKTIAASQVMSFKIVPNILNIKEEKPESLMKENGKNFELLTFKLGGKEILPNRFYLVRTFANGKNSDSKILPGSDLGMVQTSVTYSPGVNTLVEFKVYLIEVKRLKLVAYFQKSIK